MTKVNALLYLNGPRQLKAGAELIQSVICCDKSSDNKRTCMDLPKLATPAKAKANVSDAEQAIEHLLHLKLCHCIIETIEATCCTSEKHMHSTSGQDRLDGAVLL